MSSETPIAALLSILHPDEDNDIAVRLSWMRFRDNDVVLCAYTCQGVVLTLFLHPFPTICRCLGLGKTYARTSGKSTPFATAVHENVRLQARQPVQVITVT